MDNLLEYEGLVYSVVNKYGRGCDKEDLYQVGMIGLVNAFNNFDEKFNIKFSSYAYYYVLGEVTKYIRENRSVKVSKDVIKLHSSIEKTKSIMEQRLGREPTITEVSLFLEIDEEKIREVEEAMSEIKSLDFVYDEDGCEMYSSIGVVDKETSADILDLKEELMNLSEEERNIILARYFEEMTQSEASKELGISQVQVSRKEGKILEKLRCRL